MFSKLETLLAMPVISYVKQIHLMVYRKILETFLFSFFPLTFLVLILLRKTIFSNRIATLWTLVCSLFFYGFYEWNHLPLLLLSFSINYFLGKRICSESNPTLSRFYLVFGIVLNLSILGIFKYSDFFLQNFSDSSKSIIV